MVAVAQLVSPLVKYPRWKAANAPMRSQINSRTAPMLPALLLPRVRIRDDYPGSRSSMRALLLWRTARHHDGGPALPYENIERGIAEQLPPAVSGRGGASGPPADAREARGRGGLVRADSCDVGLGRPSGGLLHESHDRPRPVGLRGVTGGQQRAEA